ncbi:unnamed protein product [Rotaria sp. Silwood1]|nr:unnamed protein product [Rotaria sp. Silwood1]
MISTLPKIFEILFGHKCSKFLSYLKGQIDEYTPIRLTFDEKLAAHRSNRLNQTFGQINVPYDSQTKVEKEISDETLVPLRCKISHNTTRVQIYEKSCQALDITSDWQIRDLLSYDNITIIDRSFSFNDFRAFATAIEANLEGLTLNSVGLTSRSVHVLCQALNSCVHLNLLDLSNNKIGKKGFESIVDTLNYLPSLRYLSLANCGIEDSYGTRIGDLCRPKKLLELNLSGNEFEENACIFIGHALTENTNLLHLNLSWNLIRGVAPVSLFRGIEVNQSLTELDLSWNGLSYDGSVALRRVLIVNKVLQRLNINNCNIEWISAKLISEGLMKNSTLHYLNLAYNPITTHGVQYLIQALNVKTSAVSILDISGITVYTSTVRLAEKIAQQRDFIMKYDCEMPVHDMLGGASNSPCSETYGGSSAQSEIETKNVINFLTSKIGSWDMYMSFHSYGQLWLTPYGYSNNDPPNYQQHVSAAQAGANAIKGVNSKRTYEIGGIADVLYIATGSTVDWAYDDLKIPYSYTIELPPSRTESSVGFVLPPDQAPGVCHETYVGMKAFLVEVKKGVTGASTG